MALAQHTRICTMLISQKSASCTYVNITKKRFITANVTREKQHTLVFVIYLFSALYIPNQITTNARPPSLLRRNNALLDRNCFFLVNDG